MSWGKITTSSPKFGSLEVMKVFSISQVGLKSFVDWSQKLSLYCIWTLSEAMRNIHHSLSEPNQRHLKCRTKIRSRNGKCVRIQPIWRKESDPYPLEKTLNTSQGGSDLHPKSSTRVWSDLMFDLSAFIRTYCRSDYLGSRIWI